MYCRGSLGEDRFYEVQVGEDNDGVPSTASVALFRGDDALALWLTAEQLDAFIDALTRARLALPTATAVVRPRPDGTASA